MTTRRLKFDIRQASPRIATVLLVWAMLAVGFYLLATRPKVREYRNLSVGSEPQRQALEVRRAEVEAEERFLAALRTAEGDLGTLRQDVLATREERLVRVQLEVKALADRFSIDMASINFDSEILGDEGLDRLVMTMPLEGGYANLRKFLQAVETSHEFLVVERVALGEGRTGGTATLELSITLATYLEAPTDGERALPRPEAGGA
jgi:Tfp pilus assembly protein PilO